MLQLALHPAFLARALAARFAAQTPDPASVPPAVLYLGLLLAGIAIGGFAFALGNAWLMRTEDRRRVRIHQARVQRAVERHFNPYVSGEPVRTPQMFFARHDLLQRLMNGLHQNSAMIHGERRMGKTTLLYQLAGQLREADDPEYVFVPVFVDLEGTPQERFFLTLMDAIWGSLQGYLAGTTPALRAMAGQPQGTGGSVEDAERSDRAAPRVSVGGAELSEENAASPAAMPYTDRDFAADLRLLIGPLQTMANPRKPRIILLMDEVDALSGYSSLIQQQFRRVLMSNLAVSLGAVVAGSGISKAWDRLESPWYNLFVEYSLEPFSKQEATELLLEPVRGVYQWDWDAVDYAVEHGAGRPHRLQTYAFNAVNRMLDATRLRITLADLEASEPEHQD